MSMPSTVAISRDAIEQFAGDVFSSMTRVDQRRWAEVYLRGLLLVEGKKSIRKISEDVLYLPAHQSLQQFINQSPWDWEPVRARLVHYVESRSSPHAWVLGRTAIPKRGERSVGVDRRFVPEAGRIVNCQIGTTVSLATEAGNIPVNWRLLLPPRWLKDEELRQSAYIPPHIPANPEWRDLLSMLTEMTTGWGATPAPVIGDLRLVPDAEHLVRVMADHGTRFAVEVDGSLNVLGGMALRDTSATRSGGRALDCAATALEHFLALCGGRHKDTDEDTCGRRLNLVSSTVRLPGRALSGDTVRLLSGLSPRGVPERFWVTNLTGQSISDVMDLIRLQRRSRDDLHIIEENFGLRDFEGRSYRGWHHHMTMVSAAYLFNLLGTPFLP